MDAIQASYLIARYFFFNHSEINIISVRVSAMNSPIYALFDDHLLFSFDSGFQSHSIVYLRSIAPRSQYVPGFLFNAVSAIF
jgi:hypothetical protein